MKRRNLYTLTGGENMQRKNLGKAMRYLVAVCALASALAMVGCGGGDGGDEGGATVTSGETISSVNTGAVAVNASTVQSVVGQPVTFSNGGVFDPSLAGTQATLTFTSPTQANLTSGGSTSTAGVGFGSCTFTFTQGPLAGKSITFTTCTLQITGSNVTAGGGAVSGSLTLTLSGPFGSSTSIAITVQISILADGTLLVNGVSTGIIISSNGSPVTTGTTGTGGQ
jgi:hypothetical protein